MKTEFFMPMIPPAVTHQEHKIRIINNKPVIYEPAGLKAAKSKLEANLAKHIPEEKYIDGVQLICKWLFPVTGKHKNGEYKTTRPDTDNLQKMLKDLMTKLGYWKDDALVVSEIIEKFWADRPGIYICIHEIKTEGKQ